LLAVFAAGHEEAAKLLLDNAIELIDEYLTQGTEDSAHMEPSFINDFNGDLNAFMKWEALGKDEASTPHYRSLISDFRKIMGKAKAGAKSDRDIITETISQSE
jgi:hypothetical protein